MKQHILIILMISSLSSHAQTLEGEWKGSYVLNANVEKITAYLTSDGEDIQVRLDAPDRRVFDLEYSLAHNGDSVTFSRYNSKGNLFEFKGVLANKTIVGQAVLHSEYMKDKPGLFQLMKSNAPVYRGAKAPTFKFNTIDGATTSNEDFSDTYFMLDFWATWCKPCVAKRPKLEALKQKLGDQLRIVSISLDASAEIVNAFREDKYPMNWVHVLKSEKWDDPFINKYLQEGLPYGYLMDKNGKVIAFGKELDAENFDNTLSRVMK